MSIANWIESIGFYNEAPSQKVRALFFGDTGVGKTRLAGTFPKPFFIDADRGGKTLEGTPIPVWFVERDKPAYEAIMEILRTLRDGKPPFDKMVVETLVIDSITALADMLMTEAMKTAGKVAMDPTRTKPEWDHYAIVAARLRSIMNLAKDLPMNFVATCGTKLEKDDVRGTFVGKPAILGGYRDLISYDFDDVIYMAIEGSQTSRKYKAYTTKVSYFEAKSRSGLAPVYEDPTYEKLYKGKEVSK